MARDEPTPNPFGGPPPSPVTLPGSQNAPLGLPGAGDAPDSTKRRSGSPRREPSPSGTPPRPRDSAVARPPRVRRRQRPDEDWRPGMRRSSGRSASSTPRGSLRERIGTWFEVAEFIYGAIAGLALLVFGAIWVVQQLLGHP